MNVLCSVYHTFHTGYAAILNSGAVYECESISKRNTGFWIAYCRRLNRDYISQKDSRPTVGRFIGRLSADLSADKMPDFSSFFIGRQKINYNYLVIIFFHRPTVLGFWQSADDRPMVGRRSADDRPISRPMSCLNEPHIIGRSSLTTYHRPMCRPTIGRRSADCKVLGLI